MEQVDALIDALTRMPPTEVQKSPGQRSDSAVAKLAISGPSGVGKTVLATTLARSTIVQLAFPDGVYWLDIGREPQLTNLQAQLARALGVNDAIASTLSAGKQLLERAFAGKRALLILDDVDLLDHTAAFDVLDTGGHLLITTRDSGLVRQIGAREWHLQALEAGSAHDFLRTFAKAASEPDSLAENLAHLATIARACAGNPLAMAVVGACVGAGTASLAEIAERLSAQRAEADGPEREATSEQDRQRRPAFAAIGTALALFGAHAQCPVDDVETVYSDLAVFAESTPVPGAIIALLWVARGLDPDSSDLLLHALCRRHLLQRTVLADGRPGFRLHETCAAYVRARAGDVTDQHGRLVEAYAELSGGDFADGPDDGYFWQRLPYHLARAARAVELRDLLLNFAWLLGSLRACSLNETLASFELLRTVPATDAPEPPSDDLALVCGVITEAGEILAENPSELAGQLIGRLGYPAIAASNPKIDALLTQARAHRSAAPSLKPLFASLTPPGGPLMATLAGHASWVNAVAVLANGQRAVSAAEDRTIKIWDIHAEIELFALSGHASNITAVAVTSDGRKAVSASSDKTLIVWDLHTGASVCELIGHTRGVNDVAISADDTRAVSVSRDQTLRVWDMATGQLLTTVPAHSDYVRAVAITKDGRTAVTGARDHTVKVWDLPSGRERFTLTGHTGWINAVAVSADGRLALSASEDQTVRLWDLERGEELRCLQGHSRWVNDVAMTSDGRHAVSASRDQTLKVWDLRAGVELCTLTGHRRWVNAVALTGDGKRAVSASRDGTLKLWNLQRTTSLRAPTGHDGWVNAVAVTPDGQRAVSGSTDKTLRVWDVATGAQVQVLSGHTDGINALAVTPDGQRVVSASRDRTLGVWNLATGERECTMLGHTLGAVAVAITPDGKRAISASSDKTVRVWDVATGALQQTLSGHNNWINAIALSAGGGRIVSASEDRTIALFDRDPDSPDGLYREAPTATLRGHASGVVAIAVTPDGQRLLSASGDRTLRLWDLESAAELTVLSEQSSWINALAVMDDGRHLVTVSSRKRVEVWALDGKRPVATFTGEGAMLCCALHSDAGLLAVGDAGGTVHFLRFIDPA